MWFNDFSLFLYNIILYSFTPPPWLTGSMMMTMAYFTSFPFFYCYYYHYYCYFLLLLLLLLLFSRYKNSSSKTKQSIAFLFHNSGNSDNSDNSDSHGGGVGGGQANMGLSSKQQPRSCQLRVAVAPAPANPISISPYCDIIKIIEPAVSNDAHEGKSSYSVADEGK